MSWDHDEFEADYRRMRAEGLTRAQCANEFGIKPKTMDDRVRKLGCWMPAAGARTVEQDIQRIAHRAACICDDIREVDPALVLSTLAQECESDPLAMAQVLMALAAWVDVDEDPEVRGQRVEAITAPRLAVAG